jgi:hypothetical protein
VSKCREGGKRAHELYMHNQTGTYNPTLNERIGTTYALTHFLQPTGSLTRSIVSLKGLLACRSGNEMSWSQTYLLGLARFWKMGRAKSRRPNICMLVSEWEFGKANTIAMLCARFGIVNRLSCIGILSRCTSFVSLSRPRARTGRKKL